jgi:hypothetical protein
MKTVDIMEALTTAIEKRILGEWKHEGFIGGFTSEHIEFEIDGRKYVLRIEEVKDGGHWSETSSTYVTNERKQYNTLQDYLKKCGEPEKRYGSDVY